MAKLLGIDLMRIRLKQNGGRGDDVYLCLVLVDIDNP